MRIWGRPGMRVGESGTPWPAAAGLAGLLLLGACKQDCSEPARMGDFEFSQGNYTNAIRHYDKALKADANCGIVGEKLEEARRKEARSR